MSETAAEPPAVSNVSFVVTGKETEVRTTMRVIELSVLRNGETIPIVTMSVRAAKELRDMLTTEIGFEDQLPQAEPAPSSAGAG